MSPMKISTLFALGAAMLFGAATPISKLLLGSVNPFLLAGLLYFGAGLFLAPRALRSDLRGKLRSADRKNKVYVAGSVVFGGITGPVLMLFGLELAKSASVSLWLNMEMVATMLLGHFLFKDRMTKRGTVAATGILCASILLSLDGSPVSLSGGLLVAGACLCWGLDNHFTALIDSLSPEESTFVKGIAAGATNLLAGLLVAGKAPLSASSIVFSLAIGALSYGMSIVLYISAAQGLGATRAQLIYSSSSVFGILLACILVKETILPMQVVAMALMALSYALLFSEKHEHAHAHQAVTHTHWHRHGELHHDHTHDSLSVAAAVFGHTHEHHHEALAHSHPHVPDIHHRHTHQTDRAR